MDYLHPVPFILGWLCCLLLFEERRQPWLAFCATLLLGAGCYSYIASIVMMPIYFLCTIAYVALVPNVSRRGLRAVRGGTRCSFQLSVDSSKRPRPFDLTQFELVTDNWQLTL
jgi:hypothetical protein